MLLRVLFAGATAACFAVCNCKLHGWVLTGMCAERSQDACGATCGVWLLAMLADVLPHVLLVRLTLLRAAMDVASSVAPARALCVCTDAEHVHGPDSSMRAAML